MLERSVLRQPNLKFAIPALFAAAYVGAKIGEYFNPAISGPTIVEIDASYFSAWQTYHLILGGVIGSSGAIAGELLRCRFLSQFSAIMAWGFPYSIWHQASDPEFLQYVLSATLEFMVPYTVSAAAVLAAVYFSVRKLSPSSDERTT